MPAGLEENATGWAGADVPKNLQDVATRMTPWARGAFDVLSGQMAAGGVRTSGFQPVRNLCARVGGSTGAQPRA